VFRLIQAYHQRSQNLFTFFALQNTRVWVTEGHIRLFSFNLSKPTSYVMHQQFNIQQLYALRTLYLCVLYLSENKQRLVPLTA